MLNEYNAYDNAIRYIRTKISLMIGRAVLRAVSSTGNIQRVQVQSLDGETISDVERLQEYGLETVPKPSNTSEAIIIFPDGSRDRGMVLCIGDSAQRPSGLNPGDVCLYDCNGNSIKLTSSGIKMEDCNGNTIEMTGTQVKIQGTNHTVDQ